MEAITTILKIIEMILILGLLVMTFTMFGVVIRDLIKNVRNRK